VSFKEGINAALSRLSGYELRRASAPPSGLRVRLRDRRPDERLVAAPAFILSSIRSGSTLLRVVLDSHSQLHSPEEFHFRHIAVRLKSEWSERALGERGFDARALRYLLWDRILDWELANSGKSRIVCKTPDDVFIADRLRECWPDARFIFLLRHPGAIAHSRARLRPDADPERNLKLIRRYCEALEEARRRHDGLTLRYEDLTNDPEAEARRVCEFLDVEWEPAMLDYGRHDHGRYRPGLGDWSDKIRSGRIQAATPPADDVPASLRDIAEAWGYPEPAVASGSAGAQRADRAP
jgi:Sulfotransferase family